MRSIDASSRPLLPEREELVLRTDGPPHCPPGTVLEEWGCCIGPGLWLSDGWVQVREDLVPPWAATGPRGGGYVVVYFGSRERRALLNVPPAPSSEEVGQPERGLTARGMKPGRGFATPRCPRA